MDPIPNQILYQITDSETFSTTGCPAPDIRYCWYSSQGPNLRTRAKSCRDYPCGATWTYPSNAVEGDIHRLHHIIDNRHHEQVPDKSRSPGSVGTDTHNRCAVRTISCFLSLLPSAVSSHLHVAEKLKKKNRLYSWSWDLIFLISILLTM